MLSRDEVLKIARLARLTIGPDELERVTRDFNAILEYVQQLETIDVADVEPMSHVHGVVNVFREDEAQPSMPVSEILENAPDTHDSFIRVPIIIE